MFVVFEGIDGSGKTTLSNRVGDRLRAHGLSVVHVRSGGTFSSAVAQSIRELGRDARHLLLAPFAELLLYTARDGQSLEEVVIPALAHVDVVIADRYLYSAELLATAGRGLPAGEVAAVTGPLAKRVRPDLSILVDVSPDLARARRRVSKLLARDTRPPSRKGLSGVGLQVRLARGYRELAERHPEQWLVVQNDEAELDVLVEVLADAIATAARNGVAEGLAVGRARLPRQASSLPHRVASVREAREALLAWVDRRAAREPALAAYVLDGVEGNDADARRRVLLERAPAVIASGIGGLAGEGAWQLRDELAARTPDAVARSLTGLVDERADRRRHELLATAPEAVAASLVGRDDDVAWALRETLRDAAPDAVAASLTRVCSARANEWRAAWLAAHARGGPDTYFAARAGARMVHGCDGDLAREVRARTYAAAPVETIASYEGVDSADAWQVRTSLVERAPRPVLESITGMTQPAAWDLRARLAAAMPEVFSSLFALDHADAWSLRERHAHTWPAAVCKSLGPLATTPRGAALASALLGTTPTLGLLRQMARVFRS